MFLWRLAGLAPLPSLADCYDQNPVTGELELDLSKFLLASSMDLDLVWDDATGQLVRRKVKRIRVQYPPKDFRDSAFYINYVENRYQLLELRPDLVRRRFRLPFPQVLDIVRIVEEHRADYFEGFGMPDAAGRVRTDLTLLVLAALRVLGRNSTFDDVAEFTNISEDRLRVFHRKFIRFGREVLYPMFVKWPATMQDLVECEKPYRLAGFPGAIGSTDVVHVPHINLPVQLKNLHANGKYIYPTIAYQVTVNHKEEIVHVVRGKPGTWADKSIIRFDDFIMQLKNNSLYRNFEFKVHTANGSLEERRGAYVLVDGGYHHWIETISGWTITSDTAQRHFSAKLASMRKDVECTFGQLKKRFEPLRSGIRLHDPDAVDDMMFTCAALHNFLHDIDGRSEGWNVDVIEDNEQIPVNAQMRMQLEELIEFVPALDDVQNGEKDVDPLFEERREELAIHYEYCYERDMVMWPEKNS